MRLFRTARHLRLQQVYGRIHMRARAALPHLSSNGAGSVPGFPGSRWSDGEHLLEPMAAGIQADAIRRGAFRFLNRTEELGFPPRWDSDGQPRLWLYNLHYFDWLWSLDFTSAKRVVLDWTTRCDNTAGGAAWEPYPTSVRLINWCGYFFGRHKSETLADRDLCAALWHSVYGQCEWLRKHPEVHLLNNHYLENGVALAFAGSCFQGRHARRWSDQGTGILAGQVAEQILPDGTHFELSPMYHCRVFYVLALLMEVDNARIAELLTEPLRRASRALENLCHPDGAIALFSDSAGDVCHEPARLLAYARRHAPSPSAGECSTGGFALSDAGYYGWRGRDGAYLIADYGRIGPDHNPGHGHADMFSFELSLNGCRVITDSGVHDYEPSATRHYCRSTAAHNTVEIDGRDQCELWGAFRVARRGHPHDVTWRHDANGFCLAGRHDGYARLPGKPLHARQVEWNRADGLLVRDTISAKRPVRCVSRLHLHPHCQVVGLTGRCVRVSHPGGAFRVEAKSDVKIGETPYHPRFYETQRRPCLIFTGHGRSVHLEYRIRI